MAQTETATAEAPTVVRGAGTEARIVTANGVDLNVAITGSGPPMMLVHGWPHTWEVWTDVIPLLCSDHTVIAPDLRGIGGSERTEAGYDAGTLAADLLGLFDALELGPATVVAIDAGVAPSFLLAIEHPEHVDRLVLMEGLVGRLPGAERFLAGGAPWWFGFHSVPGLAETVLRGNEAAYVDFFLRSGTFEGRGMTAAIREAAVAAYSVAGGMRGGFEIYRALGCSAEQIATATAARRLTVPTLAVAGGVVGDAVHGQLSGVADDLTAVAIPHAGHIVPADQPRALVRSIRAWLSGDAERGAGADG